MRRLPLNFDDTRSDFIQSLQSTGPAVIAPLTQGDTIQFAITKFVAPDDPTKSLAAYVIKPWSFSAIRISLGYIDQAPLSGTFKLRVDSVTSTTITWPTDLSAAAVDTWKNGVLAALNLIAGTGAAVRSDPANTPVHFLYFTWTSPTDERVIEVVSARLIPAIDIEEAVTPLQAAPAYRQLIKLKRLPLLKTAPDAFAFPYPPTATIAREVAGSGAGNEVQSITIPAGAAGAFDLTWSGTRTAPLNVSGLTAAQIAAALNAIVVDGASNPSFSVEARGISTAGAKYIVSFIGPLAAAAQTLLVAAARGQEPLSTALGTLELHREVFEEVLNGAATVTLKLELVVTDAGGESTVIRDVELLNDMTGATIDDAIEAAGGIITITETVVIDDTTADPYVTGAVGLAYPILIGAVGASAVTFTHDAWGRIVPVTVFQQIDADTDTWREVKDVEFGNSSASDTATVVTFPFVFVNDATSAYDYRKWKVRLQNPDATVALNAHKTLWADCLASLPDGQSLTAKLAEIATALGMVSGSIRVNATQIDGLLKTTQIDLATLAASVVNQSTFATALSTLYTANPTLLTTLITQLGGRTELVTMLNTLIAGNPSITAGIATGLSTSSDFTSTMRELVFDVLQGTAGALPAGTTLYRIDPFEFAWPPPQEITGPSVSRQVPATEESTVTSGGTSSKVTRLITQTIIEPTAVPRYAALSPSRYTLTSGGQISGTLPLTDDGTQYYGVVGSAKSKGARGRRGETFANNAIIIFAAGHWYQIYGLDGAYYPREYDCMPIEPIVVDSNTFLEQRRFNHDWQIVMQLAGNATGHLSLTAQIAPIATGHPNDPITWSTIFTSVVRIGPAAVVRTFGVTVSRGVDVSGSPVLTGEYRQQGHATAWSPTLTDFAVRVIVDQVGIEGLADPRGSLIIRIPPGAASASIVSTA